MILTAAARRSRSGGDRIIGYLDDLVLVPLGVALAIRLIPAGVLTDCRAEAGRVMTAGKPVNRDAAGVIVAVWVLLTVGGVRLVLRLVR